MKRIVSALAVSLCLLSLSAITIAETSAEVDALVKKVDKLYRADNSYARMVMRIVNPHYQRTLTMDIWSQGMKKTFIRILEPAKDRGVATLRVDKEMWNYFPKIDKVMKVPPSMMMSSWMGSDFTNDDLVKETTLLDDYNARLAPPADANPDYYYIELTPKARSATVWGKIISVVRKSDYIPVSEDYYDEKGKKMRRIDFKGIKKMGGRLIPTIMEVKPLNKPGNTTVIEYQKAVFDQGVPASTFSLRNLQKKI